MVRISLFMMGVMDNCRFFERMNGEEPGDHGEHGRCHGKTAAMSQLEHLWENIEEDDTEKNTCGEADDEINVFAVFDPEESSEKRGDECGEGKKNGGHSGYAWQVAHRPKNSNACRSILNLVARSIFLSSEANSRSSWTSSTRSQEVHTT